MEIGAVKQAFNNEVIHLKRSLNQAKIQTIHKLTRRAKTFANKKNPPDKLKEKLKKKAESAVNEVLIIKKIKPRDIASFAVTHTGFLSEYLNKPTVDQDKACARLLLHKCLQEKYNTIRTGFSDISIKDLLMSRQERRKLKREALLDKKAKKDKKQKVVNAEGEWNVETIKPSKNKDVPKNTSMKFDESESSEEDQEMDEHADYDVEDNSIDEAASSDEYEPQSDESEGQKSESDDTSDFSKSKTEPEESKAQIKSEPESNDKAAAESDKDTNIGKVAKPNSTKDDLKQTKTNTPALTFDQLGKNRKKPENKKTSKPKDVNKNKNLNEKLQSRKFKKELHEEVKEIKIADPFFITSTGENYMSVAEPRQPDEVKEIHKHGNRRERRAAMFGHVPRVKPKQERQNDFNRRNELTGFKNHLYTSSDDSYDNNGQGNDGFRNRNNTKYRGRNDQFKNRNDKQIDGKGNQFKGGNDKPFKGRNSQFTGKFEAKSKGHDVEPKVEKLHPSWEAKKKQSGILPFQGKKIVFD